MTTKTDEYLTTEERRELAEFAGLYPLIGKTRVGVKAEGRDLREWKPDHPSAPSWQIQAVMEAVEDEGIMYEFMGYLSSFFEKQIDYEWCELNNFRRDCHVVTATPLQKCRATLRVIDNE